MRQVALAHERTYLHPPRLSLAERRAGTHLPLQLAPVDRHSDARRVQFPQRRSRALVRVADIPGLAAAIDAWQQQEWKDPLCPPSGAPERVEVCNYIQLPGNRAGEEQTVHASGDFYGHAWHDAVLTGGRDRHGQWKESCWMCNCHLAFLFYLPLGCADQTLLKSAVHMGKRKGHAIPLLLVSFMMEFWPWRKPQPAGSLPAWLVNREHLQAYTEDAAMRACGTFLRTYTRVKACNRVVAAHSGLGRANLGLGIPLHIHCQHPPGVDPRRRHPGGHPVGSRRAEGAPGAGLCQCSGHRPLLLLGLHNGLLEMSCINSHPTFSFLDFSVCPCFL